MFQATPHIDVRTGPGQHFVFTIEPDSKVAPGTVAFSLPQVQWPSPYLRYTDLLPTSDTAAFSLPQVQLPSPYLRYSGLLPTSGTVAFSLPQVH